MKTILVVDDAMFMRKTIRLILEKNGFTVIGEASNGLEAVSMYEELQPDIVTMDLTMPEMDGISATRAIHSSYPNSAVVIVSAMGQDSYVREAIMAGARAFIVKPFQESFVVETLRKIS